MRNPARTASLAALSLMILVAVSVPASADQFIRYKGTTSATSYNHVHVGVLKRERGRRQLRYIALHLTVTCEDSSTDERIVVLRYRRLDEKGGFSAEVPKNVKGTTHLKVEGSIGCGRGAGTVRYDRAQLTGDGSGAQLCTTGLLTWSVDRTGARPYRRTDVLS
jgi:hypothetical protein